jgi:transposase
MEILYERCCGLDIHKKTVVACLLTPGADGQVQQTIRSFGTMTADLLALRDWLAAAGCTQVAMEATGVYWKPLYNLLEDACTLTLANARHIKQVPGRKTDVRDCAWIADLLRHGLLHASFVPPRPQRELRELCRYRTSLVQERADEANRLQKTLEGGNLKLGDVASDVLGVSGRRMLRALIAGQDDPTALADLALGTLRRKLEALQRALTGRLAAHQRFLLGEQLTRIEQLEASIARVSDEIAQRLAADEAVIARLDAIPGVGRRTAEVIVAEIGTDMTPFPSAGHLASWAGMCPGNHESAGKRRSGKTRKGSKWLRTALVEAGQAAGHTKDTQLRALYERLLPRCGKKRAVVAVGHRILVIAYYLLKTGQAYHELGFDYLDQPDKERQAARLQRRLERLGYHGTVAPAA